MKDEQKISNRTLNFLNYGVGRDLEAWNRKIKPYCQMEKLNPTDDSETEIIQVDQLIEFYM